MVGQRELRSQGSGHWPRKPNQNSRSRAVSAVAIPNRVKTMRLYGWGVGTDAFAGLNGANWEFPGHVYENWAIEHPTSHHRTRVPIAADLCAGQQTTRSVLIPGYSHRGTEFRDSGG